MGIDRKYVILVILAGLVCLSWISCNSSDSSTTEPTPTDGPKLPEDFVTYEGKGFFSISYPDDWDREINYLEEYGNGTVSKAALGLDSIDFKSLFFTGQFVDEELYPFLQVAVKLREPEENHLGTIVDNECARVKADNPSYKVLSREITYIRGLEIYIVRERKTNETGDHTWKYTTGFYLTDDCVWCVVCGVEAFAYDEYDEVFDSIIRSFQPLG